MEKLKYLNYTVTCQEVPDEISLVINISGCNHHCDGCHSQYLWKYEGNYISDDLDKLIEQYDGLISCVCFMGGDQNIAELGELLSKVKLHKLHTCVYSGLDDKSQFDSIIQNIDYLKIGKYIPELGGLDSKKTNQKMYNVRTGKEIYFYKK